MNSTLPPTMRVAVELTFVRSCAECRDVASTTATAAIHDQSVTGVRLVPGTKHAHEVKAESGASQHIEATSGASTGTPEGQEQLFVAVPQSDTNGFDPPGRE